MLTILPYILWWWRIDELLRTMGQSWDYVCLGVEG